LAAFLIGFLSQSDPSVAYIHFVGVDPALRRHGVAAALYRRFFDLARSRGRRSVHAITSPGNTTSLAFHAGIGFRIQSSAQTIDGVPVQRAYDGPGLDRIAFVRDL
jgi:ribosomal protein S18 acetylase RimI-like enzyme